jgi:hypothetical protein
MVVGRASAGQPTLPTSTLVVVVVVGGGHAVPFGHRAGAVRLDGA